MSTRADNKFYARWETYHQELQLAETCWVVNDETWSWYHLLRAAEALWYPEPTEKQKQQQKLWKQRGLLELTKANLRSVIPLAKGYWKDNLVAAESTVDGLIGLNKQQMGNIK